MCLNCRKLDADQLFPEVYNSWWESILIKEKRPENFSVISDLDINEESRA